MDSIHRRIIELLQILASDPTPSRNFELPANELERHQQLRHAALRSLAQYQSNPTIWRLFAHLNRELPGGTRDQVLSLAGRFATILLPEFRRAEAEETWLTNHKKFLRDAAKRDPFLENASLTHDAYSGLGEVEPDTWSQGTNLERKL